MREPKPREIYQKETSWVYRLPRSTTEFESREMSPRAAHARAPKDCQNPHRVATHDLFRGTSVSPIDACSLSDFVTLNKSLQVILMMNTEVQYPLGKTSHVHVSRNHGHNQNRSKQVKTPKPLRQMKTKQEACDHSDGISS